MPIAKLGSIDLFYERAGQGSPLLFISGTGGDLRVKPNVFDGPLPKLFDVLAYDQRGLGRSAKPDVAYSMADYADDAASPGGAGGASYPFHEIQDLKGEDRARHLIQIVDTRLDASWAAANPDAYAQFVAMATADAYAGEPGHQMGARRQLEARAGHDTWDRLEQIRCPVFIAAGRYDGIALPATQHKLASRIAGATLRFFEGGHLFMLQDRTAIPSMVEFLNS